MTKQEAPKGKRIYLINRDFQLRYTRVAVLVGLVSTVMTVFLILFPLFQFNIIRFPNFLPMPFVWAIVAASLLNFLIVACMGILITHRIAGPMFSLVRHIRLLQSGQPTPHLKIRDGDDLKFVVRNFNELIDHLQGVAAQDKGRLDQLVERLRGGSAQEALALAEELQDELAFRLGEGSKPA